MKRRRPVALAVWLLAAAVLAGLAWVWWNSRAVPQPAGPQPGQPSQDKPPITRTSDVQSNQQQPLVRIEPKAPVPATVETNRIAAPSTPAAAESLAGYPRTVQNVFELQLVLARQGLSPGSLDGTIGPQTRSALASFQRKQHLPATGELDNATRQILLLSNTPTVTYIVSSNDLSRLQPLSATWLGKSQQTALDYESVLELVSEKAQSSPTLIRRLNRDLDWSAVIAGTSIQLPDASVPVPTARSAFLTIRLGDKVLEVWDEHTNLLAHFPCSIARLVEKRPVGELHVEVIARNPNYTFDPEIFPESAEAQALKTKLVLPPGPNNPVGIAWIGLDKPGYGIHGTPQPEQVGRTESHGCFRLANWNVDYLVRLVAIGTPVRIQQ